MTMINITNLTDLSDTDIQAVIATLQGDLARRAEARAAEAAQAEREERRRTATVQIAEKLRQIEDIYKQCQALADEAEIPFSYTSPDGMNGCYTSDEGWRNSTANC